MMPCYYCGVPANTIDHVVPRSLLRDLKDDTDALAVVTARARILEVDACFECNTLLSSQFDRTLEDRKERLRRILRRRYKAILAIPDWTDSELGQLGPDLQRRVILAQARRDWIFKRLQYEGPATRHGELVRPLNVMRRAA